MTFLLVYILLIVVYGSFLMICKCICCILLCFLYLRNIRCIMVIWCLFGSTWHWERVNTQRSGGVNNLISVCVSARVSQVLQLWGVCCRRSAGLQQLRALQRGHVGGGQGWTRHAALLREPLGGVLREQGQIETLPSAAWEEALESHAPLMLITTKNSVWRATPPVSVCIHV